MIDFTNIIDTDAGDGIHSARYQLGGDNKRSGDEVIVFDMK